MPFVLEHIGIKFQFSMIAEKNKYKITDLVLVYTFPQFFLIHIFIFNLNVNSFLIPKFEIIDNLWSIHLLHD